MQTWYGHAAVVTDDVLAQGGGDLSFEVRAQIQNGKYPVPFVCHIVSNEWKRERKAQSWDG